MKSKWNVLRSANNVDFELWVYTDDLEDIYDMNGNFTIALRKVKEHMKELGIKTYSVDLRWKELDNLGDFEQMRVYVHK